MKSKYLRAKNWRTFQHYSGRRPPWIKAYVSLLDDMDYILMSDGGKAALHAFWLLCARFGHPLPNDAKLITDRAGIRTKHLAELIARGWAIETDDQSDDASADASADASTSDSTDGGETLAPSARDRERASAPSREVEGEKETTATTRASRSDKFTDPAQRSAYEGFRRAHPNPEAFDLALDGVAEPITGNGFGWAVLGQALAEMAGNGNTWNVAYARGCCARIKNPAPSRTGWQKPDPAPTNRHTEAPVPKSDLCPFCVARPGLTAKGRPDVLHELTCHLYDATVRKADHAA